MKRFIKGLSYGFSRNLGKKDRIIRAVIATVVLSSWILGVISGTAGMILGGLAIMLLVTAASARCGINYWMNTTTISDKERENLENRGIKCEC